MIRKATPDDDTLPDDEANALFGSRARVYPWNEWLDGNARVLSLANHFPHFKNLKTLCNYIRKIAAGRGQKVQMRRYTDKGQLLLRAIARSEKQDAAHKDMEASRTPRKRPIRHDPPGT